MQPSAAFTIRALRSSDEEFLCQLSADAFSDFAIDPARGTLWMAEHYQTLVAERDQRGLGFAVVRIEGSQVAELVAIAVVERERGRGVGRALLQAVERRARNAGASGLCLHTADANVAALALFLRCGFRIRRRLPRYYRSVFAACEMIKTWEARPTIAGKPKS